MTWGAVISPYYPLGFVACSRTLGRSWPRTHSRKVPAGEPTCTSLRYQICRIWRERGFVFFKHRLFLSDFIFFSLGWGSGHENSLCKIRIQIGQIG